MRRLLVTGATGFIGQHVLPLLADRPYELHAVHWSSLPLDDGARATWHRCDLVDPAAAAALVDAVRPTHLLHLAWYAVPGRYWTSPENVRWLEASLRLVRLFAEGGGERAVAAGTCAEYDWDAGGVFSEEATTLRPRTLYGTCKHALQSAVSAYGHETGLSFAWGRIFFVYGPGEHERRLVASVSRQLLAGGEAPCTSGEQVRDFLHVADVAGAFVSLLDSTVEGPVNVGSGEGTKVADVVAQIASATGGPDRVRLGAVPTPPDDPPLIVADVGRLHDQVGWRAQIPLEEGIRRTVEWWREALAAERSL